MFFIRLRSAVLACALLVLLGVQTITAQNTTQAPLIQRTTAEIMAEYQRQLPQLRSAPPKVKVERENEMRRYITRANTATVPLPPSVNLGLRAPQTFGVEFNGALLSEFPGQITPPDSMGAVGPTQYLVATNGNITVFDKEGNRGVLDASIDVFFSPVFTDQFTFASDPRVRYDRFTQRWIVIIIDVPATEAANRVLIAVSNNSTITASTVWSFYYFKNDLANPAGDTDCFLDYPTLGVDVNALYIGGNIFCGANFHNTSAFVVRKAFITGATSSNLLAPTSYVTAFRNLIDPVVDPNIPPVGMYTPQGVDNFNPTANRGYFVGVNNALFGSLIVRSISNPGSTTPTISPNIVISVPDTSFPSNVPHPAAPNSGRYLDAIDDRLYDAVLRNGKLWTAHHVSVDATGTAVPDTTVGRRNGIRWYELNVSNTAVTLNQTGTIFDNAANNPTWMWFPSVMVSGQGHVAIGFSAAGLALQPSAAVSGRLANDPLNSMRTVDIYETGSGGYNPSFDSASFGALRWGDYSYTSLDPCDDMTLWTIQEYNNAVNEFATRVVELKAPPPPSVPASLGTFEVGMTNISLVITGSAPNGEGFYDTAAGVTDPACRRRLRVIPDNGVTQTGFILNSPTILNVNFSTVGATVGTSTIVIRNPDRQQVTTSINVTNIPNPPSNLVATPFDDTTINLSWTDNSAIETSYVIQRSPNGVDTWTDIGATAANDTTYTDTGLLCGTTQHFRVLGRNANGLSDPSNSSSAMTFACNPAVRELVLNGSYEADGDGDRQPENWTVQNVSRDRQFCDLPFAQGGVQAFGRTGLCIYGFKGTVGAVDPTVQSQILDISTLSFGTGDSLTFSMWYRTRRTQAPLLRGVVTITYGDSTTQTLPLTINQKTNVYTQVQTTAVLNRTDVASITVTLRNRTADEGFIFLEDVSVKYTAADGNIP